MKKTDKFTFFWKTKDVFSNWHPSVFTIEGITFNCSEQYMMYKKAQLFNDQESIQKILAEPDPKEQKVLGRKVKEFDSSIWLHNAVKIMEPGLRAKFEQNPSMLKELLDTGDTILAEASPSDLIWGIGFKEDDPLALDERNWKGKNLLGITLMNVRTQIRVDSQEIFYLKTLINMVEKNMVEKQTQEDNNQLEEVIGFLKKLSDKYPNHF